jgi:hypothetical protein
MSLLAIVMWLAAALAEPVDDRPRVLEVEVGKTLETPVGIAIGFRCDDPSILEAAMKTRSETENVFVVKGVKEGATLCRVGIDPQQPSTLFDVRIVASRPAGPRTPRGRR